MNIATFFISKIRCIFTKLLAVSERSIRVTYTKFGWNEVASSTACNFLKNGQFYLNFLEAKNLCLYFWLKYLNFFILQEKRPWKCSFFSKIPRSVISYWVVVRYHFWAVLRYLGVLSRKFSFVTLVNIKQKLQKFKR